MESSSLISIQSALGRSSWKSIQARRAFGIGVFAWKTRYLEKFSPGNCQLRGSSRHKTRISRELTTSNLHLPGPFREKEIRRTFRFKPDRRRTCPKRESGQAFLDPEIFTMSYTLDFHCGKTVDRSIPRFETRDSPRTVSTGESPLEKKGPKFYSRDARVLFRLFYVPSTSF